MAKQVLDQNVLWLLGQIIDSFNPGLPLGNLTSQVLVNVYMNEFDQFVKRELKIKYYVRYADDFVFLHSDRSYLEELIPQQSKFLGQELKLELHPKKVFIKTFASGIDFLGWVHFPHHRIIRAATKRKMLRRLKNNQSKLDSYLGLLKHGNTYKIIKNFI